MLTNTTHPTNALTAGPDEFDYTPFVLRTDSAYPALDPARITAALPDAQHVLEGNPADVLACVVGIWVQFSIPTPAIAVMSGVLHGLLAFLEAHGGLHEAHDAQLLEFITTDPTTGGPSKENEMRLRRNTINAAYLALEDADMIHAGAPLEVPQLAPDLRNNRRGTQLGNAAAKRERKTYSQQVHVRPATHDEMLLIRLATRLVGTSRGQHRAAAAVALCSNTATTSEAPQVLWRDCTGKVAHLPGRRHPDGPNEADIAERRIVLDEWATTALNAWREEQAGARGIHPEDPVVYEGRQALTSNSAQVSVDNQIGKALTRAGLAQITGLSAGSLRLWGAVKDTTDAPALRDGAHRAGIRFATLHRLIHELGERPF